MLGQRHCAPDKPRIDALGIGLAWLPCKTVGTPGERHAPPPTPFPLYLAGEAWVFLRQGEARSAANGR